jgi:hypothetical protein
MTGHILDEAQEASLVRVALLRCNMSKLRAEDAKVRAAAVVNVTLLPASSYTFVLGHCQKVQ